MRSSLHRRAFLRAVGAGLATLPFLRLVEDAYAQSMGEALPQRFIGVYHPHGIAAELFTMRPGDTETKFDIAHPDSPLQPFDDPATYGRSFKDKILVIEGLDLLSSTNGHESAATILTGSEITDELPQNSSLDQFLAVENGLGSRTPVTSVALAVGNAELKAGETLSFGAGGIPISKIIDPVLAFDYLFTNRIVGRDPAAQAHAERRRRLGQSLIDFVNGDVKRLRARVAPLEQQKLDQHLQALRELEKKIQGSPVRAGCALPDRPTAFPALVRNNGGEPHFDAITDLHVDLLALAMGCDITRFATLVTSDLSYAGNPLGLPADNHGAVAHTYSASSLGYGGRPVGSGKPDTWRRLATLNRYSYGKVARLMKRLHEGGILDSTLVYASSDMGNPAAHSTRDVPTVLAGGMNGTIRMGRRIKYRTDCPLGKNCRPDSPEYRTVPNNWLLVSLAQAFGVEVYSYGRQFDNTKSTGTLAEL
jgi:Protein of unknown function (DUF1552)